VTDRSLKGNLVTKFKEQSLNSVDLHLENTRMSFADFIAACIAGSFENFSRAFYLTCERVDHVTFVRHEVIG
jgi:hypothetical protein